MSLVSSILTAVGYRINLVISTSSDPSTATSLQWLNETAQWITGLCAEENSDLGRTIGTITTVAADISAATAASPCSVTATTHGLCTSDTVGAVIKDVVGMTELNDTEYTFTYTDANTGTLGIDSSDYTAYTSGGYLSKRKFDDLASNIYVPAQEGWIVHDNYRSAITITDELKLDEYNPVEAKEPTEFYVDGSNNVCFPSYPDDAYTVKIPYWQIPTALAETTDTMPFLSLMDNVFIEALTIRAQSRDEYELDFELKWQSFILDRVRRIIALRKKTSVKVTT